jgi:hypothetical protein
MALRLAFAPPVLESTAYRNLRERLAPVFLDHGHELTAPEDPAVKLVFHEVDPASPRPFLRKSRAIFTAGVVTLPGAHEDLLREAYPILVRSVSNCLVVHRPEAAIPWWFITPELGCYPGVQELGEDPYEGLYRRLTPMATSHLVLDNRFVPDLPEELWEGNERTRELAYASRVVDSWGLLPAPVPLQEVLSPQDWRFVHHLYGIGGLSYGNFSIREDERRFWMSASGVHKGRLERVGQDILLVTDYDEATEAIVLSVPPNLTPRRVSVDAVEHWRIYRRFPEVGAILHVHAWVPGIDVTSFNYPCGTVEAAEEVSAVIARQPDPGRAVVGMRNHGITATGPDFHDILERLKDRIVRQVPMGIGEAL